MGSDSGTGAVAVVGGRLLTDLVEVTTDLTALDRPADGCWVVVVPFPDPPGAEPVATCARFATVRPDPGPSGWGQRDQPWPGVPKGAWTSSLDRAGFGRRVGSIRASIAAGDVYQVNLTRHLSAPAPPGAGIMALGARLAESHPAPFAATVHLPGYGLEVASASPELFLRRRGHLVQSAPIKGTSATAHGFLAKDRAENVMIVDLMRNDLGRVCRWGSITVPSLLAVEPHPGLHHLVSTVVGELGPGVGWAQLLAATVPAGSISGAPKVAALDHIAALEPAPRGVYCGAVGWVDAATGDGDLNVAIRTFWLAEGLVHFGTGGGITWGSDPNDEWQEAELKAERLLDVVARPAPVMVGTAG